VHVCAAEIGDAAVCQLSLVIDRVAGVTIRLVASVCMCVSVRLSVGALLFEPFDFDLDFWHEG